MSLKPKNPLQGREWDKTRRKASITLIYVIVALCSNFKKGKN